MLFKNSIFGVMALGFIVLVMLTWAQVANAADIKQIKLQSLSGESRELGAYASKKPIYLKFWASYCQECMQEMPVLQKTYEKYGKGLTAIAVNIDVNDDVNTVTKVKNKFKLSLPIAVDATGELAKHFNLIGTPFHVILNSEFQPVLIHQGAIDEKLLQKNIQLAINNKLPVIGVKQDKQSEQGKAIKSFDNEKLQVLYFHATWCDWYLEKTEPKTSQNCIASQQQMDVIAKDYPKLKVQGFMTRLWTTDKDVKDYQQKHKPKQVFELDKSNQYFNYYAVKKIPTILILKNGKVSQRVTDFSNPQTLRSAIASASALK